MARPEKWKNEFVGIAKKACELGATDRDIAEMLGVSERTISYWRVSRAEFAEALALGKEKADSRVEQSLYRRAVGYTFDAVKIFMPAGAADPVHAPYAEHVAPDTTACIFWLKNRRPAEWRDKREHEHTGPDGGPVQFQRIERVIVDGPSDPNRKGVQTAS